LLSLFVGNVGIGEQLRLPCREPDVAGVADAVAVAASIGDLA
jgi:hypothetical protein